MRGYIVKSRYAYPEVPDCIDRRRIGPVAGIPRVWAIALFLGSVIIAEATMGSSGGVANAVSPPRGESRKITVIAHELRHTDSESRKVLLKELERSWVRDPEDLITLDHLMGHEETYKPATRAFRFPKPLPEPIKRQLLKFIEGSSNDGTLYSILHAVRVLGLTEALPLIRERIRRESGFHPLTAIADTTGRMRGKYVWGKRVRISALCWTLSEFKDIDSIDLLFATNEFFCGSGVAQLAKMGPEALKRAVHIARTEHGKRKEQAIAVLYSANYPEAYPYGVELIAHSDAGLRKVGMSVLCVSGGAKRNSPLRAQTKQIYVGLHQNDPDTDIRRYAYELLLEKYPEDYKDVILECIWRKKAPAVQPPLDRHAALMIASAGTIPGIADELEKFIRYDETQNGFTYNRYYAALGIWRATGRKVAYKRGNPYSDKYPWEELPSP